MREDAGSARATALRPDGLHDLRGRPVPAALRYGPTDLVVVSGLPGAGKSTLMARCAQAPLIDSQHVRESYQDRLPPWLPYAAFRPLVRSTHYLRLLAELRASGPLVIHDCGTVPLVRSWVRRTARRQGRHVHLLFLDADAQAARGGQHARGRSLSAREFARHCTVAQRSLDLLLAASAPPPGWASAVLLDRAGARNLREIGFRPPPGRAAALPVSREPRGSQDTGRARLVRGG
ncbi:ATP-binding protein [Streptomycetaceae bacterium NBC_01309]